MDMERLLERLKALEYRVRTLESENQQLRGENTKLKKRIAELESRNKELESALTNKANSKTSKPPNINFGVDRNKPDKKKTTKQRKPRKPSPGRTPDEEKLKKADHIVDIYPKDVSREECIIRDEQGVWRFFDGMQAKTVHYRIWASENAKVLPRIPGVRNSRSEYGIEIILTLGYLVYWIGISFDKACECIGFFTGLNLSKGQADSLLYQLAKDWKKEYKNVSKLITKSLILYVDETSWKVGKQNLYTWIFSTMDAVLYKVGVGRGKDVLTEMFGGVFAGIGVSDDYAVYDSAFTEHQLCWAHPLRKALELMLRNPENQEYKRFVEELFDLYYESVRLSKDQRLSSGREAKAKELEAMLHRICRRAGETIVTEKGVAKAKKTDANSTLCATSDSDAKFIRLQNQLVEKSSCYFVFVVHTAVEPTNNRSERAARPEALARKAARTSKSDRGAKRRGIIMTVLASLQKRLKHFSLANIVAAVQESIQNGIALFLPMPDTG